MGNVAAMNQLAIEIANRDDAPFLKHADTMVFDSHKDPATEPLGRYSAVRTSREGLATEEEFAAAFYPVDLTRQIELIKNLSELATTYAGEPVTGFVTPERKQIRGMVADVPFLSVRRTPDVYLPGQTSGRAQPFHTFVGSLWLPIEYPAGDTRRSVHAALLTVRRDPGHEAADIPQISSSLVFGETAVAKALAALRK